MEIDPIRKSMHVMGLHLGQYTTMSLYIYIDSILSSAVIEGSYFETKQELIDDIIRENTGESLIILQI